MEHFHDRRTLGHLLRGIRMLGGLSQDELAERARTSQGYISRVERGVVSPTFNAASVLVRACLPRGRAQLYVTGEVEFATSADRELWGHIDAGSYLVVPAAGEWDLVDGAAWRALRSAGLKKIVPDSRL